MTLGIESDGRSADDTLTAFDDDAHDPEGESDHSRRLSAVWISADHLRTLLREQGDPNEQKRKALKGALVYQLPTVVLYWQMGLFLKALEDRTAEGKSASLYILLFPGEAKDYTGIKDLNDKVIGQWYNAQFIRRRFDAIDKIFNAADGFTVAGQTYKTAFIQTYDQTRKHFAKKLVELDKALCVILLDVLNEAENDKETDAQKKKEIKKLRKKLKKKRYRFDIFFGVKTLKPSGATRLENVYLLVTEALKGAAIARYVAKTYSLGKAGKSIEKLVKIIPPDKKKLDARGKAFDWKIFMKASEMAEKIKALCVGGFINAEGLFFVVNEISIDTVWTPTFIERNNLHWGNPDVVRDVRKKKLKEPKASQGNVTYSMPVLKSLLEIWLVVLNMLDFVKRFKFDEFRQDVLRYHEDALEVFEQLGQPAEDLNWPKLEKVLTHDVRQDHKIAVLESASEFQFYSFAADHEKRIFLSMDVRDMGVELMLHYEHSNREVGYHKYSDIRLMEETFRATDAIDERRRFTYDRVVEVFRESYDELSKNRGAASAAARKAFAAATFEKLGTFEESVQIMLGGDEVYAAVHPFFEQHLASIIGNLDHGGNRTINLRASVAYSSADKAEDALGREKVQLSHQEAMRLAEVAPATLKELERTHRRIERLIDMLESNPKKSGGPAYRKDLDKLPMMKLFARTKHGAPKQLRVKEFRQLVEALKKGEISAAEKTGKFELVDFSGTVVDGDKLNKDAQALEAKVSYEVGADNARVHPPPATKFPKWIEDVLEWWWPIKSKPAGTGP